ncbi:choline transporter-like protein 1 isoform X2 [Patiria miniata]|uniref:Choline transporter-like protein n=1 Tax=Patiria miniata TaxID=46514 RepID=A0A914A0S5_PATMI|nr:choline transporter-like protein 1 isoform X2 [Patiria miniata]XP_038057484.1 choline transporter-like protein 1 isoform X2 [Patiria miniata]
MGCCDCDTRVKPLKGDGVEQVDDGFDGPLDDRSCRDVICLFLFLAFWVGMGYIAVVSIMDGQPERIIFGADSYGNVCGKNNGLIPGVNLSGQNLIDRPYVFTFNPESIINPATPTKMLCVSECPDVALLIKNDITELAENRSIFLCDYNLEPSDYAAAQQGHLAACPGTPLDASTAIFNRCIPSSAIGIASSLLDSDWLKRAVADVENSWREILYLCLISFGLAIVVLILLRFFAGVLIWTMVFVFMIGSSGGTGYLWYRWWQEKSILDALPANAPKDNQEHTVKTMLAYAGIASGVTVILHLVLLVMRKRIALVVALFKEAGKAVADIPFLLLQPVWTILAMAVLCAYWGFVYLYLVTAGKPELDNETGFVTYKSNELGPYMWWYHLFGLLWGSQFLVACQQCAIAGAVAAWFFARDKSRLNWPILKSIQRIIRYHLGSLAFGSFIIALVMLARIILGYIQNRLKHSQSDIVAYILKCLQCCLWLFEKVLRFINRNAYIEIAIYGYSFCKAARKAFTLIVSNALRVAAINSVGDFVLLLGKAVVVAAVVVVGMQLLKDKPDIHYEFVPITLAAIFAFLLSHIFLSVYEMAIDTLFLCFCEDCERNDGITKPYYMSKDLMNFVDNAKKAQDIKDMKRQTKRAALHAATDKM